MRKPVTHHIGRLVGDSKIEIDKRRKVIYLYKSCRFEDGRYFNLFGESTEYVIGRTMKRSRDASDGFYVGVRKLVSLIYFGAYPRTRRVLKCEVPMAACTFPAVLNTEEPRGWKIHDYYPMEVRTNKFTPIADVTDDFTKNFKSVFSRDFVRRTNKRRKQWNKELTERYEKEGILTV